MLMHLRRMASTDARARVLLIALAIPSILIGLLAMHVLSGTANQTSALNHHTVIVAAVEDTTHHAGGHGAADQDPANSAACGPACGQDHEMLAMACLLALLVAALTLLAAARAHRGAWTLRPIQFLGRFVPAPTEPRPPSLIALSISRT
ncbi:DUF6153 family protein [Agromyces sp. Leaf222]|uniref:DUF6153 family protein n=1 Tax=Agromyces sp. Leaf222 TaxID=1735688 RepID=UPI00070066B2|nr:DUF6153 family protein [Agromyces sp. Leaf222]KQM82382.1 hypothetical protein ASE68_03035 [Agromyces sp. Leaf222]